MRRLHVSDAFTKENNKDKMQLNPSFRFEIQFECNALLFHCIFIEKWGIGSNFQFNFANSFCKWIKEIVFLCVTVVNAICYDTFMTESKYISNAQSERVFHFSAFRFIHKLYTAHQLNETNKNNNKAITALTTLDYGNINGLYKYNVECTNTDIGIFSWEGSTVYSLLGCLFICV